MKAQYLKNQKRWTAFMTLNGLDIQEYGQTEKEARENLARRIANSKFLLEGIKVTGAAKYEMQEGYILSLPNSKDEEVYVDEKMILSLGFEPTVKDKEWPYTMVYAKDNYTIQYIDAWGQGNMDEGWLLKKDGIEIPFQGYRNTLSGKLPNGYILFKDQLDQQMSAKDESKMKTAEEFFDAYMDNLEADDNYRGDYRVKD